MNLQISFFFKFIVTILFFKILCGVCFVLIVFLMFYFVIGGVCQRFCRFYHGVG